MTSCILLKTASKCLSKTFLAPVVSKFQSYSFPLKLDNSFPFVLCYSSFWRAPFLTDDLSLNKAQSLPTGRGREISLVSLPVHLGAGVSFSKI